MIEWAKRFNKGIDETLWYQPYLQYFIYALNAFSVVRTAINCMEMSAESTFLKWYELYPFGAPEEQTVQDVNKRITSIKAKLIGKRLKMLLDAEGKSARELAESGDVLDDFEADALEENLDGEEDEDGEGEEEDLENLQAQQGPGGQGGNKKPRGNGEKAGQEG